MRKTYTLIHRTSVNLTYFYKYRRRPALNNRTLRPSFLSLREGNLSLPTPFYFSIPVCGLSRRRASSHNEKKGTEIIGQETKRTAQAHHQRAEKRTAVEHRTKTENNEKIAVHGGIEQPAGP